MGDGTSIRRACGLQCNATNMGRGERGSIGIPCPVQCVSRFLFRQSIELVNDLLVFVTDLPVDRLRVVLDGFELALDRPDALPDGPLSFLQHGVRPRALVQSAFVLGREVAEHRIRGIPHGRPKHGERLPHLGLHLLHSLPKPRLSLSEGGVRRGSGQAVGRGKPEVHDELRYCLC